MPALCKPGARFSKGRPPFAAPGLRHQRGAVSLRLIALLLIALAVLGAGGYYGWQTWLKPDDPASRYLISTVAVGDLEDTVTATGTLQPRDYVDVGAQVSGQLKRLLVEIGTPVQQGDLLAEIDAVVQQTRVESGRAGLANLNATLTDRQAQLELAERQYQRQQNLLKGEATTTESVQTAEAQVRSARAQLTALKASITQAESTLRGDEANLGFTKIYAPMAGTVVSVSAKQGQTLNANQSAPVILRIADLSTMTVGAQVSEADISKLRLGMPVYFTTLGSQGRRWVGTLRKTEPTPTVTSNVVLYNALFDVPNPQGQLMTQMTAQVFFVVASAREAVLVPVSALRPVAMRGAGAASGAASGGRRGTAGEPAVDPAASSASAASSAAASDRAASDAERPRRERRSEQSGGAESTTGSGGTATPPGGNRAQGANRPAPGQRPRFPGGRALVTVVKPDNTTEEREVKVGAITRVQAQILEGLAVGERVVIGTKAAADGNTPAPRNAAANRNPQMGGPRL
ncbi:MAG: efflux transporter periplasmic adaptor subunit [Rhizobacter sp.]|nr:efflux transporter periplasmic adaptor subunit [Rhizobacter sp.]